MTMNGGTNNEGIADTQHHGKKESSYNNTFSESISVFVNESKKCLGLFHKNESMTCDSVYFSSSRELHAIIPPLLEDIYLPKMNDNQEYSERRISALRQLYELTSERNESNRIPLVCTCKWDIISALAYSISHNINEQISEDDDNHRRIACLALNNLSIPYENKAVMSLGNSSNVLIASLTKIIYLQLPESYMCFICLMNLTNLEDAVSPILYFSPNSDVSIAPNGSTKRLLRVSSKQKVFKETYWFHENKSSSWDKHLQQNNKNTTETLPSRSNSTVLLDHNSFINSMERCMKTFTPFLQSEVVSVEKEAIRWSLGLLRNITKTKEHCALLIETEIPAMIVSFIKSTNSPVLQWTENSIEESSLLIMCNLVQYTVGQDALKRLRAHKVVEPIIGKGGIHDYRAGVIQITLSSTNTSI